MEKNSHGRPRGPEPGLSLIGSQELHQDLEHETVHDGTWVLNGYGGNKRKELKKTEHIQSEAPVARCSHEQREGSQRESPCGS